MKKTPFVHIGPIAVPTDAYRWIANEAKRRGVTDAHIVGEVFRDGLKRARQPWKAEVGVGMTDKCEPA